MTPTLYLVDSSALAYRSFFAFIKAPLRTRGGDPTSAVFGYVSSILRLFENHGPTHLAVVQDPPGPTFRHRIFPEYKATRKPMPEDLQTQWPIIDEFLRLSGLPVAVIPGFEADDVIATLAYRAREADYRVRILSRDKDLMQLVDERIHLYYPGGKNIEPETVDAEAVEAKFGVPPSQIRDLLALMGDASDNVPGVTKVGVKTAAGLLHKYGSFEEIYAHLEDIPQKALRRNLENDREQALLSQKLVTLRTDLTGLPGIDDFLCQPLGGIAVSAFLDKWEMTSLKGMLAGGADAPSQAGPAPEAEPARYRRAATRKELEKLAGELEGARTVALDTETTGLDSRTARLVGLCLSAAAGTGAYIPIGHEEGENADLEDVRRCLGPILSGERTFVFHNAKYDLPILDRYGLAPLRRERVADTMVAAHLLTGGRKGISLDELALEHLGHRMIPISDLIGKKSKDQISFAAVAIEKAVEYGAEDADMTLRLWEVFRPRLAEMGQDDLFRNQEMPLLHVLLKMEARGIGLDSRRMKKLSTGATAAIENLERHIVELAGEEFNVNSTQQLGRILFEKLGLKAGKKTKTGRSTDVAVLNGLLGEHPIIEDLLEYRELAKLKNTYIDVLPSLVRPQTGRLHTTFSQTIAATGRLSSINPNLQNIPVRTAFGRQVRECFIAKKDHLLLSADYSQVELRILAHLSGDRGLVDAYTRGRDIHARTAAALYEIPEEDVTPQMRRSAKVVNFGVIYGMGATRLSRELKLPLARAREFIERYFQRYAGVLEFKERTLKSARERGWVETLSGRRRYLPELQSNHAPLRLNAERIAVNTPIQGSAADLIKRAMIRLDGDLGDGELASMLLQVHDELVFEVHPDRVEEAAALVRNRMEGAMALSVPLLVEVGTGPNWLKAHE